MHYLYVIQSPCGRRVYVGQTSDLRRRMSEHQAMVKHRGWRLVYYEAYRETADAVRRERRLKHHGAGWRELKKRLMHSLKII